MRAFVLMSLLAAGTLLSGCVVTKPVGAAVDVATGAVKVAATVAETAVDVVTRNVTD